MSSLLEIHVKNNQLGHGYLLVGDIEVSRRMALEAASALFGYAVAELKKHPDFYHQAFELFGIKESHELKGKSSLRPFIGEKKIFILEIFSFSIESANALLKIFEEPPEGTHFFIIVPSVGDMIPTLRSRLIVIDNSMSGKENKEDGSCGEFLRSLPGKRMEIINKIGKDKNKAAEFLNGLELAIFRRRRRGRHAASAAASASCGFGSCMDFLDEIRVAREFLSSRSPNVKMILEHIALTLPKV